MLNRSGKNGKRVAAVMITLCLLAAALFATQKVTSYHLGRDYFVEFFEEEENVDVLFLGSSHMMDGVLPMELWEEYGISSYNLAYHGCMLPLSYWVLKMSLEYTEPSLVVLDCANATYPYKIGSYLSWTRLVLSSFPFSLAKVQAVLDLADDALLQQDVGTDPELSEVDAFSLLWDFAIYHSRWNDIEDVDFTQAVTPTKGGELNNQVIGQDYLWESAASPDGAEPDQEAVGFSYLEKILALCQEEGIEVLLVNIPYEATADELAAKASVSGIAAEYGVDYIDLADLDVVNYATDGADYTHLNPSGARKITSWLGAYLSEHYDLPDRREDADYAYWDEDFETYLEYKIADLKEQTQLDVYLMLLADDDYVVEMEIGEERIFESSYYLLFLENLGIDPLQTEGASGITIEEGGKLVTYSREPVEIDCDLRITVRRQDTGEIVDSTDWELLLDLEEEQSVQATGRHE